eukprot:Gb_36762 [translate_table: standard]
MLIVIPVDNDSKWGNRLARFICDHGPGYFPITLIFEEMKAFNPNRAYVLAVEPHSIFPFGITALCNQAGYMPLPRIKFVAANFLFCIPLLRHIWCWMGMVAASKENFVKYLERDYSCIVIPGGHREMFHLEKGSEVVYLKKRFGFVRVAIETGCPLVPVFCFGQTETYRWWKAKAKLYHCVARAMRVIPLIYWGRFGSPIPYRHPLHIVVGKLIEVEKNPQPTKEEVVKVHTQFVLTLQELFERHKVVAGYKDTQLQIL